MKLLRQTFPKKERIKKKKDYQHLLDNGKRLYVYPFKIFWNVKEIDFLKEYSPVKVGIAISKKNIKKTVLRNLIKRRIREAYRKNKYLVYDYFKEIKKQCNLLFIFVEKKEVKYSLIEKKIIEILMRLKEEYAKDFNKDININN